MPTAIPCDRVHATGDRRGSCPTRRRSAAGFPDEGGRDLRARPPLAILTKIGG